MPFRFEDQEHQLAAVGAFVDLLSEAVVTVGGELSLDYDRLLTNLRAVQARNGLAEDDELLMVAAQPFDGDAVSFPNFSAEMETGTGKTYAYIRTALTLSKRFGLRRFLVVVPSVAIREGTNAAFEATRAHFTSHPDLSDVPYSWQIFRSDQPHLIDDFTRPSNEVQFLITTLAAFNRKDDNRIYRESETLHLFSNRVSGSQMQKLQSVSPVLILDEPQNMESPLSKQALATIRPLIALRFSASHENLYNLVYRLGPTEARDLGLVKRVAVRGVSAVLDPLSSPVSCRKTTISRRAAKAYVSVAFALANGELSEREVAVAPGDDLAEITGRRNYAGYIVDEIRQDRVMFENGETVVVGESDRQGQESVWRDQIGHALRVHFERQADLDSRGVDVKVLSLFFVENVHDYVGDEAVLPRIFAEEYERLSSRFPSYTAFDASEVRGAYFSQTARGKYQDASTSDDEQRRAVDLILRKKEQLLSKKEPISFIFSHTALGEGWDNPNVFQICFLRHSKSEIQRRQQVGRGLRLPVTQEYDRVFDGDINRLTLVVDESYDEFVAGLNAEYGIDGAAGGGGGKNRRRGGAPPVEDDAKQVWIQVKESKRRSNDFQELWRRIRYRTKYHVTLDETALLAVLSAADWDALNAIGANRNVVAEAELEAGDNGAFVAGRGRALRAVSPSDGRLPDLIALVESALHDHEPRLTLTRRTIATALRAVPVESHRTAVFSPEEWAAVFASQVRSAAASIMVNHIRYEARPESEWYDADVVLRPNYPAYEGGAGDPRGVVETSSEDSPNLYSHADFESGPERDFVHALETAGGKVRLYVRLPRTFDVATPVGTFSPDYAVVAVRADSSEVIYLVQEIKSTLLEGERRQIENQKIRFARKHFKAAPHPPVEFAVTTGTQGLRFESVEDDPGG